VLIGQIWSSDRRQRIQPVTSASDGNVAVQAGSLIAAAPDRFSPSMSAVGDPENPAGIGCDTSATHDSIRTSCRPAVASRRSSSMGSTFGQSETDHATICTTGKLSAAWHWYGVYRSAVMALGRTRAAASIRPITVGAIGPHCNENGDKFTDAQQHHEDSHRANEQVARPERDEQEAQGEGDQSVRQQSAARVHGVRIDSATASLKRRAPIGSYGAASRA